MRIRGNRWALCAVLCVACGGASEPGSGTSGDGDGDGDIPDPFEGITLEPVAGPQLYAFEFYRGADGEVLAIYDDRLWATRGGVEWTVAMVEPPARPVFVDDGTMFGLERDGSIGQGGGFRVVRPAPNGDEVLPAPWDSLDVTTTDLVASGDALWVQIGSRKSDVELDGARFFRLRADESEWTEVEMPGDTPRWQMVADGAGGVWLADFSSPEGPWTVQGSLPDGTWREIAAFEMRVPMVFRSSAGTWFVSLYRVVNQVLQSELHRSTDDGQTWSVQSLSDRAFLDQSPNGTLVRIDTITGDGVALSTDDGLTWTPVPSDEDRVLPVPQWRALDDRLISSDRGLVTQRLHDEPRWRLAGLPRGPGHAYLDVTFHGDTGMATLFDGISVPDRKTVKVISYDGGETWTTAAQPGPVGKAVCGGVHGWFVGGRNGIRSDSGDIGVDWVVLSGDGQTAYANDVINEIQIQGTGGDKVRINAIEGAEVIDCVWSDNAPSLWEVRLSISSPTAPTGVLVEGVLTPQGGTFTARPLPEGAAQQAPMGIDAKGAGVRGTVASGTGNSPLFWDTASDKIYPWFQRSAPAVDGDSGLWGFSNGDLAYFGYLGNDRYNELELPVLSGFDATELFGVALSSDARVWVATDVGLFRSADPVPAFE